jgi:GNAT superfamily N-acetyltransferase
MRLDDTFVRRHTADVELRDGTRVRLRPIVPDDKPALVNGFARLSPESRYRRFMTAIDALTPQQLMYLTEIDYVNHFAWIAFAIDQPGTPGLGVGRYVRLETIPDSAEAAVAVVDEYHNHGLGTLLLEALATAALENGISRFRFYVLEDNRPMLEVLHRLGAHFSLDEPGVLWGELEIPSQLESIKDTSLYRTLRAAARGEVPVASRVLRPGGAGLVTNRRGAPPRRPRLAGGRGRRSREP